MPKKLYLNRSQIRAALVHPWSYYGIIGRGGGKSRGILSTRSAALSYEMPGASFGFYGDSYINLMSNLIPNVITGWNQLGYIEGLHYVVDRRPPEHFKPSIFAPETYKHTISWCNGTIFYLISEDRISSGHGRSFQHLFGDEIKLVKYDKLRSSIFPAVRGERIAFGNVPQFQGYTFTTDMPEREDCDWLLDKIDLMSPELIDLIFQIALYRDSLMIKLLNEKQPSKILRLNNEIALLNKELNIKRKGSVMVEIASTFVNVDALGLETIENYLIALGWTQFKIAVLTIRSNRIENSFYKNFSKKHLYSAINYDYYDAFNLLSVERNSMGDRDCDPDAPLLGGMDFGNMDSLTIHQEHGREFRTLKNFFVLAPLILEDLAKQLSVYYKHHKNKILILYYDRAGNSRRNSKYTLAQEFKKNLEDLREGWVVKLMSIGWGNVPHAEKRLLWDIILSEKDNRFPRYRINEVNAKETVSSIELAPVRTSSDGEIKKDKRSEKLPLHKLPMFSTNLSDSVDYVIWGKYSKLLPTKGASRNYAPNMNKS